MSSYRAGRLARVREQMSRHGLEGLVLALGADLPWLTGYEAMPLERPTALVVPLEGEASLYLPLLEAPRVHEDVSLFRLIPWKESQDPFELIASSLHSMTNVAISDRAWSSLLLGLQGRLPAVQFTCASSLIGPIRAIKDAAEIAALRCAGSAADRVADALLAGEVRLIGRTEKEVSTEIGRRLLEEGHERVNFAIVGSGPNSASPHHGATDRVIARGDPVVCDFGGAFPSAEGLSYCSDTTRTLCAGEPNSEFIELYGVLLSAQQAAVAAVRPGVSAEHIDEVGRSIIEEAGYGEHFIHRIGHGIGLEEHEEPYIVAGNATPLVPGHSFSVEPGIYLPASMGARIEDIVVVSADGVEVCNNTSRNLVTLDR